MKVRYSYLIHIFILLVIMICVQTLFAAAANSDTIIIDSMDASIKTSGGVSDGNWCLWANGTLAENVDIVQGGTYMMRVRAHGSPLDGIWPLMALSVDGGDRDMVVVNSDIFTDYLFQIELTEGPHTLGVSFVNDAYNPGIEDRNLYLDRIEISPIVVPVNQGSPLSSQNTTASPTTPHTSTTGYTTSALGSSTTAAANSDTIIIDSMDASIKTSGGVSDGNWCLWANGTLAENVDIVQGGTYMMHVRAHGSPLDGIWPLMALSVDGGDRDMVVVNSDIFTDYLFQIELTEGPHTLGVSFVNDAYNPGIEDRNLYLDRIEISPSSVAGGTSITLTWNEPSTNIDGSTLTDLAGYKLYIGPSSGNYTQTIAVGNKLSYTIVDLPPGTHYFCVTAVDLSENESVCSNEVNRTY